MSDVSPIATFSPSPGITVDRTERSISITGKMELNGPEANAARAATVQQTINSNWTHTFPDGYSIRCNVVVSYVTSTSSSATSIEAAKGILPSHLGVLRNSIVLNAKESDAFTWAVAHEFGHLLGLKDRYSESILSRLERLCGGSGSGSSDPGYTGNLMAETGGMVSSQNAADILAETAPSPYWINYDDQVRTWVLSHPRSDVVMLSTVNKINAIRRLKTGWVSQSDIDAIGLICSCVRSTMEANAIRSAIDPTDFTDIGQRGQVRIIFAKMPH